MEKRLLLAVLLMSAVILITNLIFPSARPEPEGTTASDTAVVTATAPPDSAGARAPVAESVSAAPVGPIPAPIEIPAGSARTIVVTSGLYRYEFSTRGAALLRAELLEYDSYTEEGSHVQLVPDGTTDFLAHRIVVGGDTVDLRRANFEPSALAIEVDSAGGPRDLRFTYTAPEGLSAEITYTFRADRFVVAVSGRILGLDGRPAVLLTEMGPGLAPHEALEHHSERELGIVSRTVEDEVNRTRLAKIENVDTVSGPLAWVGIKDKYFLAAQIASDSTSLLGARAVSLPVFNQTYVRDGDTTVVEIPRAELTTALAIAPDGSFSYEAYLGPQDYQRMAVAGSELQDVTQYAYTWLEPIIRPFAAFILWILTFLHDTLGVGYGWVLILFGVLMRVILWPLNAKAMRSQMKTAAVAPIMQEIKQKYKNEPEKQQQEMLRIYREYGVNPLSGCLPMLIPWPVLITLFFVFENTIAFRGVTFLWFPDLSLRDPLNILPVLLVVSMFAMQWISTHVSGTAPTAQTKSMMYIMPLMMGIFFFNLPSGLNLYYVTSNVSSIPQQLLIAQERRRAQEQMKASGEPSMAGSGPSGGARRPKKRK